MCPPAEFMQRHVQLSGLRGTTDGSLHRNLDNPGALRYNDFEVERRRPEWKI
jgi:hypothetical protein